MSHPRKRKVWAEDTTNKTAANFPIIEFVLRVKVKDMDERVKIYITAKLSNFNSRKCFVPFAGMLDRRGRVDSIEHGRLLGGSRFLE